MTFTSTTIRKLRALNLEETIFEKVLEIFEEAKEVKKKGSAADRKERGTRLPADWVLPKSWGDWSLSIGMHRSEIVREATKFKNYWLNAAGAKGIKLKWDLTWQNWCLGMLERAGREVIQAKVHFPAGGLEQDQYSSETWEAIVRRFKSTGNWNPGWGPSPSEIGCKMPARFLSLCTSQANSEMGP